MSEGATYSSDWERTSDGFRLWLQQDPSVEVVGSDFDEAADELASRLGELFGDGETVLEFLTPRPPAGTGAVVQRLRYVGYNESVRASGRLAEHYLGGLCAHCEFGIGRRTDMRLGVDRLPKADIAGVDRTLPPALVVSDALLECLATNGSTDLDTQPIESLVGSAGYHELVGSALSRTVGVRGAQYPTAFHQSWLCSRCGRYVLTVDHSDFPRSSNFLAASSLPDPIPEVFVFDDGSRLLIGVTEARWRSMTGVGLTGVVSGDLFVIHDSAAERPELPTPEEFDWFM